MHESEKWKGSRSVLSDSSWPHGLQPTRPLLPWDFPGKSTGVGCHRFLRIQRWSVLKRKYNSSTEVWEKGRKTERSREKTRTHGRCVITGEECYYRHVDSLEISLNLHGAIRRSLFVSCAVDSAYSHGSRFIEQWLANTLTNNTKFSRTFAISPNFHSSQFFKAYNFRPNLQMIYNLQNLGSRRLKTFPGSTLSVSGWPGIGTLVLQQLRRLAILLPVHWFQMLYSNTAGTWA